VRKANRELEGAVAALKVSQVPGLLTHVERAPGVGNWVTRRLALTAEAGQIEAAEDIAEVLRRIYRRPDLARKALKIEGRDAELRALNSDIRAARAMSHKLRYKDRPLWAHLVVISRLPTTKSSWTVIFRELMAIERIRAVAGEFASSHSC
jgi:hypothetical protein